MRAVLKPKYVLIADPNGVVREHLVRLIRTIPSTYGLTPILTEFSAHDLGTGLLRPSFSRRKFITTLRTQKLFALLINSELGMKLGSRRHPKRGSDGQAVFNMLRKGKLGNLNRNVPILSIFGDYRVKGGIGIVNNNITLNWRKAGMSQLLELPSN